ncbi:hypothetical protein JHK87_023596 [Glycine soja]|nr:hypothetical protein JHK87_023596 [Glycine soja]
MERSPLTEYKRVNRRDPLTWAARVQIALDAARGLEYIHEHTVPVYIHRDIKSANILIDKNFRAKVYKCISRFYIHKKVEFCHVESNFLPQVADFGLTKLTEYGSSSLHTRLVGTFGYMPPEYAQYGDVSSKIDVYAFGVVLYELISGKEAIVKINEPENESKGLVSLFEEVLGLSDPNEDPRQLVDPRLGDKFPLDSVFKNENCISKTRNHQTEDKLEFLRHSNSFGIRKEQNDQYAYKSPKSRQKDTMSCVKNSTALGIELSVVLGERSNQCTDNLTYKIPRRPRDFGSSKKRKVQDIHKLDIIKSKSMGEDVLVCSKRTELPFRKWLEAKKCLTLLKKKRKLENNILINNLEDNKVYVPSKTNSRSKARKMDDVKDTEQTSRRCHQCMKKERAAYVNILTHTAEVTLTDEQNSVISKLKKAHIAQDEKEHRA